jgi:hypothetical protein
VGGDDFLDAFFLGVLGGDDGEGGAFGLPAGEQVQELVAGLLLGGEAFLGDEIVGGVAAVVGETLGIPGQLGDGGRAGARRPWGGVEEGGGLVEVGEGV